ncbi:MAG: hypothetical protein JNM94_18780 [Phycisphaerae bacterium]|nr:hypothetical protein [Phycisphaerae bacterium]
MLDVAPLLVALLLFAATLTFGRWLVGHRDRSTPRCRRCGADARPHAWDDPPTCACGHSLSAPGGIRLPRRRRRRLLVVAAVAALAAVALGAWSVQVRSGGAGWTNRLPARVLAWLAPVVAEYDDFELLRRSRQRISPSEAEALLDAQLRLVSQGSAQNESIVTEVVRTLSSVAQPRGALADRVASWRAGALLAGVTPRETGTTIDLAVPTEIGLDPGFPMYVRPLEVRIDDVAVPFRSVNALESGWLSVAGAAARIDVPLMVARDPASVVVEVEVILAPGLSSEVRHRLVPTFGPDPLAWGVPMGRVRTSVTGVDALAVSPNTTFASPVVARMPAPWLYRSGAWGWFVEPMTPRVTYPVVERCRHLAIGALGVAAGLLAFIALVLARTVARRRARLMPPACRRCDALLRGDATHLPERCTECGHATTGAGAVLYARPPVRRVAFVVALSVFLSGAAIAVGLWGSIGARRLDRALVVALVTPEAYGAWYGAVALDREYGRGADARRDWAWSRLPTPEHMSNADRLVATRAAADVVMRDWRGHEDLLQGVARHVGQSCFASLGRALQRAVAADIVDRDAALATIREMIQAASLADLGVPLAVRVGKPFRVVARSLSSETAVVVREVRADGTKGAWSRPDDCMFDAPKEPGEFSLTLEWGIVFVEMNEQLKALAATTIEERLEMFPLTGRETRSIVALADTEGDIELTDARFDPIMAVPEVLLYLRPAGEHVEATIAAWLYGYNVGLRGEWTLELPGGAVVAASGQSGSNAVGIGRRPDGAPERIVARYRPIAAGAAGEPRRGRGPSFIWAAPTEIVFERRAWRENDDADPDRVWVYARVRDP